MDKPKNILLIDIWIFGLYAKYFAIWPCGVV